ncbi:MAG: transposase [Bdellovibrionota bacterium]
MFEGDKTLQNELFGLSYRDVVPSWSDVWLYIDLFEALDLEAFNHSYQAQGQSAKAPRLILQTLFYGLTHGVVSGRKLETVCRNDNRFIVLSGNLRPDRRTLDRFIRRHEKRFEGLFVQVVRLAQAMGMVKLGKVAIDGSKFKAQANKSIRYDQCDEAVREIRKSVKKLKKDLMLLNKSNEGLHDEMVKEIQDQQVRKAKIQEAKKKIEAEFASRKKKRPGKLDKQHRALADVDAIQVPPSKGFFFGYNMQAAVMNKARL